MSKCFTNGEGPAVHGAACAFPFQFAGKQYSGCVDIAETRPENYNSSIVTEAQLWCSTSSQFDTETWGYCGSCLTDEDLVVVPESNVVRYTLAGCKCEETWKVFGHAPCASSCCSPDNDANAWCVVEDTNCEPTGWGYCQVNSALQVEGSELTWFDRLNDLDAVRANPSQTPSDGPTQQPNNLPTVLTPTTYNPTSFTTLPPAQKYGTPTASEGALSVGAKAGIVSGAFILLLVVVVLYFLIVRKIKSQAQDEATSSDSPTQDAASTKKVQPQPEQKESSAASLYNQMRKYLETMREALKTSKDATARNAEEEKKTSTRDVTESWETGPPNPEFENLTMWQRAKSSTSNGYHWILCKLKLRKDTKPRGRSKIARSTSSRHSSSCELVAAKPSVEKKWNGRENRSPSDVEAVVLDADVIEDSPTKAPQVQAEIVESKRELEGDMKEDKTAKIDVRPEKTEAKTTSDDETKGVSTPSKSGSRRKASSEVESKGT